MSQSDSARWHLTYDDGNQEDAYVLRPSDKAINTCRLAAPDAGSALYFSPNGWQRELVEWWLPVRDEG